MLITASLIGCRSHRQLIRIAVLCTGLLLGSAVAGCGQNTEQQGEEQPTPGTTQPAASMRAEGTTGTGGSYRGPETYSVTVTETVDGDTVVIEPAIEGRTALRLVGVDTPELDPKEPLAEEAADFTEEELEGEQVTLILAEDPVDPYGRLLGTIKAAEDQSTHGQNLLREGYAQTLFYDPNTQYQMLYLSTQENAKERGAGIWGLPLGERCELASHSNGIGSQSPECEGIGG